MTADYDYAAENQPIPLCQVFGLLRHDHYPQST